MKTLWSVKKFFFERYETFMGRYFQLKEDDTYLDMVADIEEKIDKEVQLDKAIKRVMIKYRDKFDPLFQEDIESDDEHAVETDEDIDD